MLSLSAAHVHLLVAILAEVVATSSLKASDGLSRPLPTAVVVIGYVSRPGRFFGRFLNKSGDLARQDLRASRGV